MHPFLHHENSRVLIVRPSEAQARKPYDLYLSRIVMEFQNSFFKYKTFFLTTRDHPFSKTHGPGPLVPDRQDSTAHEIRND